MILDFSRTPLTVCVIIHQNIEENSLFVILTSGIGVSQDPQDHKICLYECPNFEGRKMEVCDEDIPSLWSYGFQDRVASIQVTGGT